MPRSEAQSRYERVVGIVQHNTFDDRPLIARKHIGVVAINANMQPEKVDLALQAAVRNQDLLRIQRHGGLREYAVVNERSVRAVFANSTRIRLTDLANGRRFPKHFHAFSCKRRYGSGRH